MMSMVDEDWRPKNFEGRFESKVCCGKDFALNANYK
jgi:hypothetical protein